MREGATGLTWGVERRLEFIEFRLYWEGGVNRGDITEFFGVSVPQASKDLSQYQELAPGNMEYDKSEKRYFAAPKFAPKFLPPDSDFYLSQLRAVAEKVTPLPESWLSEPPALAWMPVPERRVESSVLRRLLAAIRERRSVEVLYQSMNPARTEPLWRGISPHALGGDSMRWHVRAFCHIDRKFKDFLLSRCMDCRPLGAAEADASHDRIWNETIDIKLKPNPKLSKSQQKVIAVDYGMEDGSLTINLRKALLYYFNKRLRLDVAEVLDSPQEAPIVVANRKAFDKALAEAKAGKSMD